jgi:hypothetical protein
MSGAGLSPLIVGHLVDRSATSIHFRPTRNALVAYFSESALQQFDENVSIVRSVTKDDGDTQLVCYSDRAPRIVGDQVQVFGPISLLTASRPVLVGPRNKEVDVHLLFGVASPEKLFLMGHRATVKFGTSLPRLTLDTRWIEFAVVSEPFVIKESVGYTTGYVPAVEVKVQNGALFYLSLHAKSVCEIIEAARTSVENGPETIVGNLYRIRKKSDEKMSGFEGFRIPAFGSVVAPRGQRATKRPSRQLRRTGLCRVCRSVVQPYHIVCSSDEVEDCPMK